MKEITLNYYTFHHLRENWKIFGICADKMSVMGNYVVFIRNNELIFATNATDGVIHKITKEYYDKLDVKVGA